jgi:hypothetical protein
MNEVRGRVSLLPQRKFIKKTTGIESAAACVNYGSALGGSPGHYADDVGNI